MRGNAQACYLEAFPNCTSERAAAVSGSRLVHRPRVLARIAQLRETAAAEAVKKLREWHELAVEAQETIRLASTGKLPKEWTAQQIRSAIDASLHILDRAIGSVKQMHEVDAKSGAVLVFALGGGVAAPEPAGREIETEPLPVLMP